MSPQWHYGAAAFSGVTAWHATMVSTAAAVIPSAVLIPAASLIGVGSFTYYGGCRESSMSKLMESSVAWDHVPSHENQ